MRKQERSVEERHDIMDMLRELEETERRPVTADDLFRSVGLDVDALMLEQGRKPCQVCGAYLPAGWGHTCMTL